MVICLFTVRIVAVLRCSMIARFLPEKNVHGIIDAQAIRHNVESCVSTALFVNLLDTKTAFLERAVGHTTNQEWCCCAWSINAWKISRK